MQKILMSFAALCALSVAPSIADAAVRGVATANVNMRSGPSTGYPAVDVIPEGAPVTIYGCMSSVNWCDVAFSGGRGWVSGNYVQSTYRSNRVYVAPNYYKGLGIPTVTFNVGNYWGRYYRDRDFYRDRDRWDRYDWRRDGRLPPRWSRNGDPRFDRDRSDRRPRFDDDVRTNRQLNQGSDAGERAPQSDSYRTNRQLNQGSDAGERAPSAPCFGPGCNPNR